MTNSACGCTCETKSMIQIMFIDMYNLVGLYSHKTEGSSFLRPNEFCQFLPFADVVGFVVVFFVWCCCCLVLGEFFGHWTLFSSSAGPWNRCWLVCGPWYWMSFVGGGTSAIVVLHLFAWDHSSLSLRTPGVPSLHSTMAPTKWTQVSISTPSSLSLHHDLGFMQMLNSAFFLTLVPSLTGQW